MSNEKFNYVLNASLHSYTSREARICVIGLGYVGLPLAVEFALAGFSVLGLEITKARVDAVNMGKSPVLDVSDSVLTSVIASGHFRATDQISELSEIEAYIICVPTPLRKTKEPDISFVISATEFIRPHLKTGQLIVLESTTYPGTTDELILGMLEDGSELKADQDFFLAFSPERIDPGNPTFNTRNITKVVGGIGENSTKAAVALYSQVLDNIHAVSSARVAETAKLLENTFRAVNIGLVNEIAQLCHELNIDVWEVVNAAATKPFGFMPFYPGPGIGGHCIPLDPHYLAWRARLSGFEPRFIALADQVNSNMPRYVVSRLAELLNDFEKSLKGSHILVFGVAYKANIDDSRESPALEVIHFLTERGAIVRYVDSYIASVKIGEEEFSAVPLDAAVLAWADVGVVLTGHSDFDWSKILPAMKLVFDTRNAIKLESTKVVKL
jgi:UDP-N-acetyl-D-glucosamine dehydrogenase